MITRRTALLAGATTLAALAMPALAQPVAGGRPVRLVVPFPPGGCWLSASSRRSART